MAVAAGWFAYVLAWIAAALFWSLAAASSSGQSPVQALPYGLLAMGSAAIMGVGVWQLTDRVPWRWRAVSFWATHGAGIACFAVIYATSWMWPDVVTGRLAAAIDALQQSPVTWWNLLMGSWLYLIVAGLSYTIRAHRRLRAEEAAAAEARLLAQQAQLAALRAQINPHFLFNALHSVGALIGSDPAQADRALESLGDLLRYALRAESEVPFEQEWRFTEDYLAFEHLRLGDRLRVHTDVDPAARGRLVPPLILQPLVENAVRHGIADRPDGGCVRLAARVERRDLLIRVADDGRDSGAADGEGLGLLSVRRRLAAMYGDRASVAIERDRGGYSVTIRLPVRDAGERSSAA